jgi:hypothetical protein
MPARVALGNVGGIFRFVVSKPGFDVFTAADSDMLFDSAKTHIRLLQTGTLTLAPNQTVNITVAGGTFFSTFIQYSFPALVSVLRQPLPQGVTYSYNGTTLSFTRGPNPTTPATIDVRYSVWGW